MPSATLPVRSVHPVAPGLVVHLIGRLTEHVSGYLLPLVETIAAMDRQQLILVADDDIARQALAGLPVGAVVHYYATASEGAVGRAELARALLPLAAHGCVAALHLHGLRAGLAAAPWLHRHGAGVQVYLAPHSSRALQRSVLLRAMVTGWLRLRLAGTGLHTVVNLAGELTRLGALRSVPLSVLESPVDARFFQTSPLPSRLPLVVVDGGAPRSAAEVLQQCLATSIGAWVELRDAAAEGAVTGATTSAGLVRAASGETRERAQQLGAAWVFVAPAAGRGFPMRLAEAMAAGLACVALDSPGHRSLIDDGRTGCIASSLDVLVRQVLSLLDRPLQRHALGAAAREAMRQRVHPGRFRARAMQMLTGPDRSTGVTNLPLAAG